jgi:hypothetical protein
MLGRLFFMTSGKRAALVKTRSNLPKKMRSIFSFIKVPGFVLNLFNVIFGCNN